MNFLHKWLQRQASPAGFERLSAAVLPWLAPLAWALLAAGVVWGRAFAPMDYQQKNSFRIIYIHVPAAMLSMSIYVMLAVASLLFFVWRSRIAAFFALRAFADPVICPLNRVFLPPRWSTLFVVFYGMALYALWLARFWRGYKLLSRGVGIKNPFTPGLPRGL